MEATVLQRLPYTDQELISEMKGRGYKVAKADRIRQAGVSIHVDNHALIRLGKDQSHMSHIYRELGANLGTFLMTNGAVPVIKGVSGVCQSN